MTMFSGPFERMPKLVELSDVPSKNGQGGKVLALNIIENFMEWIAPGGSVSTIVNCGVANSEYAPGDLVSAGDADSTGFPINCGGAA